MEIMAYIHSNEYRLLPVFVILAVLNIDGHCKMDQSKNKKLFSLRKRIE